MNILPHTHNSGRTLAPIPATLPATYRGAALRGMQGHCPRCGGAELFRKWLKPVDHCRACGQDWSTDRADDFPAYIAIFVTGHLIAPLLIMMIGDYGVSAWATLAVIVPLAVAMLAGMLQPAKGAVLATMWWSGIGSFARERQALPGDDRQPDQPGRS